MAVPIKASMTRVIYSPVLLLFEDCGSILVSSLRLIKY